MKIECGPVHLKDEPNYDLKQNFYITTPMALSMLKPLFLSILLLIAAMLLVATSAFSNPLPQQPLLLAQTPGTDVPMAAEQPAEPLTPKAAEVSEPANGATKGTTTNSEAADRQPATEAVSPESTPDSDRSESAGPYDMEMIKAFNRALYGS